MRETVLQRYRAEYQKTLKRNLEKIIAQLSEIPEVTKVLLFGSYATGRRDLFTDLDLLVVMESELDFVSRTAELYRSIQTEVDLDLFVYTPEEIEWEQSNNFIRQATATGEVVYEK